MGRPTDHRAIPYRPLLLAALCLARDIAYSRFVDDLVFSSRQVIGKKTRRTIRGIIEGAGFTVNHRKSRIYDLERDGQAIINGVGIRRTGELFLPRRFARRMEGLALRAHRDSDVMPALGGYMAGVFRPILDRGDGEERTKSEQRVLALHRKARQTHRGR